MKFFGNSTNDDDESIVVRDQFRDLNNFNTLAADVKKAINDEVERNKKTCEKQLQT